MTVRDINKKINKKEMDCLDFSSQKGSDVGQKEIDMTLFEDEGKKELDVSFELESDDESSNKTNVKKGGLLSRFTGALKSFTGNKLMTEEDLAPVFVKFKEDLMGKNVAEEIARKICDSIKEKILNQKTGSFASITKTVKKAFEETLTRILTPKKHIDIISEAMKCREKGKPYVGVFIGVNGVGKSTNLAKIAY